MNKLERNAMQPSENRYQDLITLPEIMDMFPHLSYNTIRWALIKKVVKPYKIGRYTFFDTTMVNQLKSHFNERA